MSLIGFSAQNHPQQVANRRALDGVDDRRTPPEFWLPLHERHGFTVDAAASSENALLPRYWTRETDALQQSWRGERVWCNPPFSEVPVWVEKAWKAMRDEGAELVVMLLPANRTEQGWWQQHVEPFRDGDPVNGVTLRTRFLRGRVRFIRPDWEKPAKGDRPPFGVVLLTWDRLTAPRVGATNEENR
jgi:phage N-6-adenine-methyltransferase